MPEPPKFPTSVVFAWVAAVTDIGALALLWLSPTPVALKTTVSGVLVFGLAVIVAFHLGRVHQWHGTCTSRGPTSEPPHRPSRT